ncbi:3-deoxy-7-phosphoheptulonate synthase [Alginatibacterium sediminis]|uniref:Phospho-2-dehydro-3-deoxyheptonate aldolase n=1 Tax=Alginatibacterium sediminis TaxID=2164068 RepID=A0A420EJM1_9ALTE|nr:3-deoxy-7-phosphoheptulonate synthase [Alginatibacterium sediminis]RKF20905.1 3-deoxy-7-phosphoheptulonate synthase [Alginatibacterium sediminis]
MPDKQSNDIHIQSQQVLISPEQLREKLPASEAALSFVRESRQTIANICHKKDPRLLVITGPCSIHDLEQAKEYAVRLKKLHDEYRDSLFIVMRVYFEKPRTTVGWKGFINDPHMDNSFDLETGLHNARELLTWIAELGLPVATEALDPISPQFLSELFSWAAIGARTTESQTHREMASGLSMPVGFKNGTDGNLGTAINAMQSAASPHRFMGINTQGQVAVLQTQGNPDGHVILRGGKQPNYDSVNVALAEQAMERVNLDPCLVVDCSHSNSHKNHELQPLVAQNVVHQINDGNRSIIGIMLESNLHSGAQSSELARDQLKYGVSVTDACIGWNTTTQLISSIHQQLSDKLAARLVTE